MTDSPRRPDESLPADALDRVRDLPDDAPIAPLGKIGYTFDNLVHGGKSGCCESGRDTWFMILEIAAKP